MLKKRIAELLQSSLPWRERIRAITESMKGV
jgi:hypothetical protein